ncbi:MAG: hypothetical protein JSR46_00875 [Verrucomicrobia bacterium]|nr:hypothetical protein [Verrucomicrobiota bacterium]
MIEEKNCFHRLSEHQIDTAPLPLTGVEVETETALISMPSLCTNNLHLLPASLETDEVQKAELGSQGFFISDDGSFTYSHESNVSLSFYKSDLGLPFAVNMDRGGVVTRPDGSHAACIADGASGDGFFSAFVAQMICEHFLKTYLCKSMQFTENSIQNRLIATDEFYNCAQVVHKQSPNALQGSSTALFVECVPVGQKNQKNLYRVQTIALGDGAAFLINFGENKIAQLNKITRRLDSQGYPDATHAGGLISSKAYIERLENTCATYIEASEDDYIILVTDGFLDNVRDDQDLQLTYFIARHPFFDQPVEQLTKYDRFWENWQDWRKTQLPTIEQLKKFICDNSKGHKFVFPKPTPEQVTKRLATYVKLITHHDTRLESALYKREMPKPEVLPKPEVKEMQKVRVKQPISPIPPLSVKPKAIVEQPVEQKSQSIPAKTNTNIASIIDNKKVAKVINDSMHNKPKTDDCMIITMKPGSGEGTLAKDFSSLSI